MENTNEDKLNAEMLAKMQGVGEVDAEEEARSNEVDPFESIPHVTPGKPGFLPGKTLAGYFVRTKRVVNENSKAAKIDPVTGERVRMLHIFRDKKETVFGIWGVGALDATMRSIRGGDWLAITYEGLADTALKPGQNPPHKFTFKGHRADGSKLVIDWDSANPDEVPPPAANAAQAQMRQ